LLDASGRPDNASVAQLRRLAIGFDVVRTNRKLDYHAAEAFMNRLRRDPGVKHVEIDRIMKPLSTPNDPGYPSQWHYFEATGGINMPAAWDLSTGSGAVVAVLDTGVTPHTDLNANIVSGYDFISDLPTANDGNGRDSDPSDPGDWAAAGDCGAGDPATDENSSWHGTHVAGTIAAVTNNSSGVAGIAYNAKVMPLRVLGHCGGYASDIADAIVWAVGGTVSGVPTNANPVEVLNLSLGGTGSCGSTTQTAINTAVAAGAVVVVAAGNEDADASTSEPANCQNVIAVGATSRAGARASYSNYGSTVDVSAPGGDGPDFADNILSTWNTGTTVPGAQAYAYSGGTSMATPHVAAVAALMQSAATSSPATVESVLKSTARALPVACPQGCGAGIINAFAAIGAVGAGALTITDVSDSEGNSGTKLFSFTVNLSKPMASAVTFDIATANGTATAGSDYVAVSLPGQSIAAGVTSKVFTVTVNGDTSPEAVETFFVNVSNVSGIAVADAQGQGSIINDDATALSSGVAVGPISGSTGQDFLYSLDVPAGRTSVTFTTSGGSGDADLYVKFGALPTVAVSDCASEGATTAETCQFNSPQTGTYYVLVHTFATISGVSLTGTYLPAFVSPPDISVGDVSISEGNAGTKQATFTVSVSKTSASPVTFDVSTSNGTAVAGVDYVANAVIGQNIAAGQTSGNFAVTINGDTAVEDNESFAVNLANVSGATVVDGQALGRITNDDQAVLSIGDVSVAEGDSGQTTATFTVQLSTPMPSPVTFDIATSNGTATAGSDYVARSQSGRYLDAGRTRVVFEVGINGDTSSETNETFNVTISNVSGAVLGDGAAVGTIVNDDAAAKQGVDSSSQGNVVLLQSADTSSKQTQRLATCKQLLKKGRLAAASAYGCAIPTRRPSR
jgi:serine protease